MTFRSSLLLTAVGLSGLFGPSAAAQQIPIRVLASNGMKAVVEELQPRCERAIGHPLGVEYGSTVGLRQKIDAGAPFDVAILTSEAIGDLVKEAKATAGTQADFAKCGVGVAIRAGSAKPDISSPAALKRTLREAASITYAGDGASRRYIDKMLERLGLADEAKSKIVLTHGSGPAMASVASGRAAIVMTLMSELLPVHGIDVVGPFPSELQNYVSFGAAVGANAHEPEGAKALIAFLRGSEAAPVYKSKGMEAIRGR